MFLQREAKKKEYKLDPEIENLVIKLKQEGTEEIKNILIQKLSYLINQISARYITYFGPRYGDDIKGEATLAFVQAINNAAQKLTLNNNIIAFIIRTIDGQIANYLHKEQKQYQEKVLYTLSRDNYIMEYPKIDLEELLRAKIIKSHIEAEIVRLKSKGFHDREIAELYNLSRQRIIQIRIRIIKRLRRNL